MKNPIASALRERGGGWMVAEGEKNCRCREDNEEGGMDERRTLHYKWGKINEKVKIASFWFLYFVQERRR